MAAKMLGLHSGFCLAVACCNYSAVIDSLYKNKQNPSLVLNPSD